MFDAIKGIIGDIASGTIKDQRIALSQEQLVALESKLVTLSDELAASKSREGKLASDNKQACADLKKAHDEIARQKALLDYEPDKSSEPPFPSSGGVI